MFDYRNIVKMIKFFGKLVPNFKDTTDHDCVEKNIIYNSQLIIVVINC